MKEEAVAAHTSDGRTSRGAHFAVHSIGPFDVAAMWERENYSALDTACEHGDETDKNLVSEAKGFFTGSIGETIMMREGVDTNIVEPE